MILIFLLFFCSISNCLCNDHFVYIFRHILAGTIKDTVTRYAHQTGHYVSRRFGWDCHGLPIEYEIDKRYNIKSSVERE